jgi:hypothetical protein
MRYKILFILAALFIAVAVGMRSPVAWLAMAGAGLMLVAVLFART